MTRTTTSFGLVVSLADLVVGGLPGEEFCGADCARDGDAMSVAMQKVASRVFFAELRETLIAAAIVSPLWFSGQSSMRSFRAPECIRAVCGRNDRITRNHEHRRKVSADVAVGNRPHHPAAGARNCGEI